MKRTGKALLLLAAMLPLTSMADNGVLLKLKNGTEAGFAFSEKPVIYTDSVLTMRTTREEVVYDYADVQRISIGDVATDIAGVKAGGKHGVNFKIAGHEIDVVGLGEGIQVSLYSADGKLIDKVVASGGTAVVRLPESDGVYIVSTSSGISYKVLLSEE